MNTSTSSIRQTRAGERRRHPRWQWKAELQGICVDPQGRRAVETLQAVDISKGGLGAVAPRDHSVGQHFVLGLPQPSGRTHYVHAEVVRRWHGDDGTHMGMQFSDTPVDLGYWMNIRLAA